ncbi:MAG: GGDEF domain-containing protein [Lachnospiraceae bacterium]|nr:GGDEF domain-containing protein [Lachnospiraceae bacterium]
MTKRVAVFIGQINQDYTSEMAGAVVDTARELGYVVDIFSEFGSYGQNYLHAEGERNIIHLPFLEDYDGVIIGPDTFGVPEMEKQLDILLLQKAQTKPIVSLRQEKDCFYSVQIDNYLAMRSLTEHFVKDHGYRKICFMKGRADLKDAQERLQGYLDVMSENGLSVTEHMLFQGNYWRDHGEEAVEWFLSGPEMPEAIICANDFMAISVLVALKERNLRVPEDVALAGFDDLEEVRYLEPAITSVHMPCYEIGRQALYLIDKLNHGGKSKQIVRLPADFARRKSCGCEVEEHGHWAEQLYSQRNYLSVAIMQNGFLNADYESCDTIEELFNVAYQYSGNFVYDEIYVCLCEATDAAEERLLQPQQYTEYMTLRAIMSKTDGLQVTQERFARRELLPEKYRHDSEPLYFYPMHHKNRCLGYLVLKSKNRHGLREFFNCWTSELCSCLDKVLLYEENKALQEFRLLSTIDELTGLYNRRKFEQELSKMLVAIKGKSTSIYVYSLDMDGLKTINDTYGHMEGDAALCAFADVITDATKDGGVCFRVGGDEFMILAYADGKKDGEWITRQIEEGIEAFNQKTDKPYKIAGSIGYSTYKRGEEISNCIRRADVNMYADKMAKKQGRK